MPTFNEDNTIEQLVITSLKNNGWTYISPDDLDRELSDVMVEFHKMIGLKPCWFTVVEQEKIDLCKYQKENK